MILLWNKPKHKRNKLNYHKLVVNQHQKQVLKQLVKKILHKKTIKKKFKVKKNHKIKKTVKKKRKIHKNNKIKNLMNKIKQILIKIHNKNMWVLKIQFNKTKLN